MMEIDMQATNGVVLATEKKLRSTLIDESTVKKISVVSPNIGLAYSGMGPDSRLLVRRARKQAQACTLLPCMSFFHEIHTAQCFTAAIAALMHLGSPIQRTSEDCRCACIEDCIILALKRFMQKGKWETDAMLVQYRLTIECTRSTFLWHSSAEK